MLRVVRSATSEDRVAKAIRAARTSFWPDGVWDARPRVRTPAEQRETRRAVERRLKALPSGMHYGGFFLQT